MKKSISKIVKSLSVVMVLLILMQTSMVALAASSKSPYTNKTYTHQSRQDNKKIINGIDVSAHNKTINWKEVAASGIEYVFIRVGYTGYTTSKFSLNYDSYFEENIKGASNAGLAVGIYWYSQALNVNEAEKEAEMALSKIAPHKSKITLPVVFDYEFAGTSSGRLDSAWKEKKINKASMTQNTIAFCDTIAAAGFVPCVYANKSFLSTNIDGNALAKKYPIWLAHYTTNTDYKGDYEFWQYSSDGQVKGITGRVDCNFWYSDQKNGFIENQVYTGKAITPKPVVTLGSEVLVEGEDYTLSYSNNTKVGTATVTVTGTEKQPGLSRTYKFSITPRQVTGLELESRTKTSLTFKWKALSEASGYTVYVTNDTKKTSFYKSTKDTKMTLNNLSDTHQYSVKVVAYSGKLNGPFSKTNTKHTLPGKVSGVKVSGQDATSVSLKWNKKEGADGYYIYQYSPGKKTYTKVATIKGNSRTTHRIPNKKASTIYYFHVAAYTEDTKIKTGAKSAQVKTATKPVKPSTPALKSPSSKKIQVKWKKIDCSGYQVQYSTKKNFSSDKKSVNVSGTKNSAVVTTSKKKKTYYVRVRAYKTVDGKKVYGAWSGTKSVKSK